MKLSRRAFAMASLAVPLMGLDSRHIQVHGHRGARARLPENTLPAFRYSIEQGVDALELDVVVTNDNVVVVSHDPWIDQGVEIRTLTFAELSEYDCGAKQNPLFPTQVPVPGTRIPSLDEVFALGHGNTVQFNVETKIFAESFTQRILDLIRKHAFEPRVILQSFDPR